MLKSLLLLALCAFVLNESTTSFEAENHRVARQSGIPKPVERGINVASQMAQKAAETAERAIEIGKKVMDGMAQGAMTAMTQNPTA